MLLIHDSGNLCDEDFVISLIGMFNKAIGLADWLLLSSLVWKWLHLMGVCGFFGD